MAYRVEDVRRAGDCREYLEKALGCKVRERGEWHRYAAPPWRPESDSGGFAANAEVWHDHATGEKGDLVDLVKRTSGVEFKEALDILGKRYGCRETTAGRRPRHEQLLEDGWTEVNRYHYHDADGLARFFVVRMERETENGKEKTFLQGRHDGAKTLWGLKGVGRIPYDLPAWKDSASVIIVEGEKDVHTLKDLELPATTFPQGAGNLKDEYGYPKWFEGKHVVVLPDNDDQGRYHADLVAWHLRGVAASIRILTLSETKHGDVTDWMKHEDGSKDALIRLIDDAERITPPAERPKRPETDKRRKASRKNGRRGGRPEVDYYDLACQFARVRRDNGVFKYRFYRGAWRIYRIGQWQDVSKECVEGDVLSWLQKTCSTLSETKTLRNVMANLRSLSTGLVADWVKTPCWLDGVLKREDERPAEVETKEELADPANAANWMPMTNGILHLPNASDLYEADEFMIDVEKERPGVWIPSTPNLFTLNALPYAFDPAATCEQFDGYMQYSHPNLEDRRVLQMLAGYSLMPLRKYNVFFVLFGLSGSGKSVFLHVLHHLVGDRNVCSVPLAKFADERYSHLLTENLLNVIADMGDESGRGWRELEGILKKASDGETMDIRKLYSEGTKARATARTVFSCNELPRFHDKSDAIWRRIRVIPFNRVVAATSGLRAADAPPDNPNLRDDIVRNEMPGVFNWALRGLRMVLDSTVFPEHSEGEAVKKDHRADCDPMGTYLQEHFVPSPECSVSSKFIFKHWSEWAEENGYRPYNVGMVNKTVERVFHIKSSQFRDRSDCNACHGKGCSVCPRKRGFVGLGKCFEFEVGNNEPQQENLI